MAKGDGGALDIDAREKVEWTFFSLGTERKSAWLCQLHDGPIFFAPTFGGVQEAGFACVWRAGPSVSQAICSSCAYSLGSSRALCAASHGPASGPGLTRLDLQAGSCRAEPRGDPCWLRAPAGAARSGSAGAGRRQKLPPMAWFSIVDGSRHPGVALGITGDHSARMAVRGGVGCVRRRAKG